jgi:hypothetical protein
MSRRFIWLALIAYGGIIVSLIALVLFILGFAQVGQCSSVDNTWEACMFRENLLASLGFFPLLGSSAAAVIALCLKRKPGEKGKWMAASAFLVAPFLIVLIVWGLMHSGIK